jgi:hypothetical protein
MLRSLTGPEACAAAGGLPPAATLAANQERRDHPRQRKPGLRRESRPQEHEGTLRRPAPGESGSRTGPRLAGGGGGGRPILGCARPDTGRVCLSSRAWPAIADFDPFAKPRFEQVTTASARPGPASAAALSFSRDCWAAPPRGSSGHPVGTVSFCVQGSGVTTWPPTTGPAAGLQRDLAERQALEPRSAIGGQVDRRPAHPSAASGCRSSRFDHSYRACRSRVPLRSGNGQRAQADARPIAEPRRRNVAGQVDRHSGPAGRGRGAPHRHRDCNPI